MKCRFKKETKQKGERCFDILKTLFSIVLAGILGAAISHHYKILEENGQIYTESRKAATTTYYQLIDTIGKRHYYALRATIGFQYKTDQEDRWKEYDKIVVLWNEQRYSMLALVKRYFGKESEDTVYDLIKKFNHIHQQLLAAKNKYYAGESIPDLAPLLDEIYALDDDISNFSSNLQERLKEGKVDIYTPKPPIKKP